MVMRQKCKRLKCYVQISYYVCVVTGFIFILFKGSRDAFIQNMDLPPSKLIPPIDFYCAVMYKTWKQTLTLTRECVDRFEC